MERKTSINLMKTTKILLATSFQRTTAKPLEFQNETLTVLAEFKTNKCLMVTWHRQEQ